MIKKHLLALAILTTVAGCDADIFNKVSDEEKSQQASASQSLPENVLARINDRFVRKASDMTDLNEVIDMEVVAQVALNGKLSSDSLDDIEAVVENIERRALFQAYRQQFASEYFVNDEDVQQKYAELQAQADLTQYQFKYARFDEKEAAETAIATLNKDPQAEVGGFTYLRDTQTERELEWARLGQLPPMFGSILPTLTAGEVVDAPLASNQGYFVVRLLDKRTQDMPTLDELRSDISRVLIREAFSEHLQDLRSKAMIQIK